MGKSFAKFDGSDKRAEKQREKERRNLRNKRKMVFEPVNVQNNKKNEKSEYTY